MTNIQSLEFAALTLSGENYLQWAFDIKIALKFKGLGECIVDENNEDERNRYKAISIIRHHLAESLKNQYVSMENPLKLWQALKTRYDHHKTVMLPKARHEWRNLRFMDYKSVEENNSAMFKIISKMNLCGEEITEEEMLEKTFSTFHTSNIVLQQQYRGQKFKTYSELISCLLLAEKNNELVVMNNEMRPPGSTPVPEAFTAVDNDKETNHVQSGSYGRGRGRGCGRGKWQGGRGRSYSPYGRGQGRGFQPTSNQNRGRGFQPNFNGGRGRGRGNISQPQNPSIQHGCHKCGMGNHWAKTCRTPKFLIDLYQKSLKRKNPEANMVQDQEGDFDHEQDNLLEYETSDCLKE
ncbi:hypothetical protein V5N11_017108 [Cardamine amara subsp. amara]|uniref:CCHC-type domain-containing protein n=1 Tax=Cardamine amara subsp. amara TaxID=228776 RepID=A0ABD0ZW96_CARAN